MFRRLNQWVNDLPLSNPWNINYAVGRSLLALSTLLTLIFNPVDILFKPGTGFEVVPGCHGVSGWSIFCLMQENLEAARYSAILILCVVVSGFYPRITGLLHWWVAFSLNVSCVNLDGGDQVNSVLTLWLLPMCLTDARKNHWEAAPKIDVTTPLGTLKYYLAYSAMWVVKIQVAAIYLLAGVTKFAVEEWANGTALYYWFNDPLIGATTYISQAINYAFQSPAFLVISTWSILILELLLFGALFTKGKFNVRLYITAILFHVCIAAVFGIISFATAMCGALTLFLLPFKQGNTVAGLHPKKFTIP